MAKELQGLPQVKITKEHVEVISPFNFIGILVHFKFGCIVEQTLPSNFNYKKNGKALAIVDITTRSEIKEDIIFKYHGKCVISSILFYDKNGIASKGVVSDTPIQTWRTLKTNFNSLKSEWGEYDWDGRNDMVLVPKLTREPLDKRKNNTTVNRAIKMIKVRNPQYTRDSFLPYIGNLNVRSGIYTLDGEDYSGPYFLMKKNKAAYIGSGLNLKVEKPKKLIKKEKI